MEQKIKPKTIVYGDVQEADEVLQGTIERMWTKEALRNMKPDRKFSQKELDEILERSNEEVKDLTTECNPSDQKPTLD